MATSEGCCHLTGAMLNLAAEAADRARIGAGVRLERHLTTKCGCGLLISRQKGGRGNLFLSWEKAKFEESNENKFFSTFVATKGQKSLKITLNISLELF
jgi:hypothetical protein